MTATADPTLEEEIRTFTEPLRWSILTSLTLAPASAAELAEGLGVPVAKVRYQLRRLARTGFVVVHDERRRRGTTERVYVAENRKLVYHEECAMGEAALWDEAAMLVITTLFREALEAIRAGSLRRFGYGRVRRLPMTLDERGLTEIAGILDSALERLFSLQAESQARLEAGEVRTTTVTSGFLLLERL